MSLTCTVRYSGSYALSVALTGHQAKTGLVLGATTEQVSVILRSLSNGALKISNGKPPSLIPDTAPLWYGKIPFSYYVPTRRRDRVHQFVLMLKPVKYCGPEILPQVNINTTSKIALHQALLQQTPNMFILAGEPLTTCPLSQCLIVDKLSGRKI